MWYTILLQYPKPAPVRSELNVIILAGIAYRCRVVYHDVKYLSVLLPYRNPRLIRADNDFGIAVDVNFERFFLCKRGGHKVCGKVKFRVNANRKRDGIQRINCAFPRFPERVPRQRQRPAAESIGSAAPDIRSAISFWY